MALNRLRSLLSHFMTPESCNTTTTRTTSTTLTPATNDDDASRRTAWSQLPTFDELPAFKNFPGCAWDVWGPDDQLGTVNLLTEEVVQRAAREEIVIGKSVSLNWPLNFPDKPMFGRQAPKMSVLNVGGKIATPEMIRDDEIHINTQSGTQWDGLRHFGILEHGVFYNNTPAEAIPTGSIQLTGPQDIDPSLRRIGIQNWADHGICGRGVLLDLVRHQSKRGTTRLPYDPWSTHGITVAELEECAVAQGVKFRQGDILMIRVGWIEKYHAVTQEERDVLAKSAGAFAGIEQSDDMKRFLWNNHFAAIASDQPALERWPPSEGVQLLHQTILGLWGMPIGEFFDLEKLSKTCAETGRYTFFFSSWPLNIIGGCASPANAAAYF